MRRLIITLVIIALVIWACVAEMNFLNSAIEALKSEVNVTIKYAEINDSNAAQQQIKLLEEKWTQKQKIISIFIDHEPLSDIDQLLCAMKIDLEQDELDDFFRESAKMISQLNHLRDTEMPHLYNIL